MLTCPSSPTIEVDVVVNASQLECVSLVIPLFANQVEKIGADTITVSKAPGKLVTSCAHVQEALVNVLKSVF